ncbi:hypothetical protein JTE90_002127 [Oedothorax gibbosus]|uniref:BTB domain-containing protein n=1 Tax=Oedothorax gibbosus TaxID=931172 RepID=A0AAV6V8Q7_9ARAC|nr:hypothetical protein JTE90_002127 [Oedothorax gibbosus]
MKENDFDRSIVKTMIHYIYCGKVQDLTPEISIQLYSIADKYNLRDLKDICVEYILENPDSPMDDLQHLYTTQMFSDFTLKVRDEELKVHKLILCARSSVFNTMLNCDMKENRTNCLEITDFDPSIVKTMIHYIYCGQVQDFSPELSIKLYSIADKYNLQDLKDICVEYILENPDSLMDDLQHMYTSQMFSDFTLKVGDEELKVHKLILCARSSVFNTMLNCDMKENRTNCLEITDFDTSIVKTMIHYIYCGQVQDFSPELSIKLYSIADKYNLQDLKDICVEYILENPDSLMDDLQHLYTTQMFSDFTLKVGDEELKVHKLILCARSSVFNIMLNCDIKENRTNCLEITDFDTSIVKTMIHYIYCGQVQDFSSEFNIKLYSIADKYNLQDLKDICVDYILENPDSLMDDLQHLYTTQMFSDFTLKVRDEELKVHKLILCARSSVFNIMLNCDIKENRTNCLEITDFDPSIVKTMIHYIYCGQVQDFSPELSIKLYSIADKYNLQDLKDICVEYILENPDSLMDDLQHMYTSQMFSDFTLKVGDEELKVHKLILCARSSVFNSTMLNCDMKENRTNCLEITDFDPSIVKTMIHYIYCGKVQDFSPELSIKLYSIADKYNLQDLKNICVEYILGNINIDNVCDVLTSGELHDEPQFKTAARDFICTNAVAIQETEKWLSLSKTMPHLILDMNRLVISQMKNTNTQYGININTMINLFLNNLADELAKEGSAETSVNNGLLTYGKIFLRVRVKNSTT